MNIIRNMGKRWEQEGVKFVQKGKGICWHKTLRTADCSLCKKYEIELKEDVGFLNWGLLIHELDATGKSPEVCPDCMKEISGDIIPAPRFAECSKCKIRQREKIYGVGWPGWKQLIIPTRQSREIIRNLICPNCVLELAKKLGEKYIRATWTALTYSSGSLLTSTKMTQNQANFLEAQLGRDNLFPNATFASRSGGTSAKPDGYTLEGSPTVAYDTVDTGYGDFAVKFTASAAADEGMNITLTHLKVSAKYQVFARVKVDAGDTASLITTGGDTNINADSTSATYEDIVGEFITDASGTDVVVKFVASADTDVAYFCGITCVEGDIPPGNFIRKQVLVEWTDWIPTLTGNADLSGYTTARYYRIGGICFIQFFANTKNVTSSGSAIHITLPFSVANTSHFPITANVYDGAAWIGQPHVAAVLNTNYITVTKTAAQGAWAGTENGIHIQLAGFFEIA